jgi:hypothetical protein
MRGWLQHGLRGAEAAEREVGGRVHRRTSARSRAPSLVQRDGFMDVSDEQGLRGAASLALPPSRICAGHTYCGLGPSYREAAPSAGLRFGFALHVSFRFRDTPRISYNLISF